LKFERVINKKRKEYRDAGTKENINKLNQELLDVKNVITESFEMLLNRDKNLNKLTELGKNLSEDSAKMKKDAKSLKL
jgi:vesicle transport protein SEC22